MVIEIINYFNWIRFSWVRHSYFKSLYSSWILVRLPRDQHWSCLLWHNDWIVLVSKKHELLRWFGIDLTCAWLWVQTLVNSN